MPSLIPFYYVVKLSKLQQTKLSLLFLSPKNNCHPGFAASPSDGDPWPEIEWDFVPLISVNRACEFSPASHAIPPLRPVPHYHERSKLA